ncbi:MAG: hypothetical protein AAFV25_07850 [Bacteroidota bacterium]
MGPLPNTIIFQYNPATLSRTLQVWNPNGGSNGRASLTAQPNDPPETFNLELQLDAADALEKPSSHPIAFVSGVADRIAAMEMLLYPQEEDLAGELLGAVNDALGGLFGGGNNSSRPPSRGTVPVVLFVWGPGRIVPVRLTSFTVEEQAFSPLLYPIRAKVTMGLQILSRKDFPCNLSLSQEIAVGAFQWTRKQKQVLAAANTANTVESILGMLPL